MAKCEFYYSCDQATESCENVYDFMPDYKDKLKCAKLRKKWMKHRKTLSDWSDE